MHHPWQENPKFAVKSPFAVQAITLCCNFTAVGFRPPAEVELLATLEHTRSLHAEPQSLFASGKLDANTLISRLPWIWR